MVPRKSLRNQPISVIKDPLHRLLSNISRSWLASMGLATNTYKYKLEKKNKFKNMVFMQFRIQVDLSTIISHKDRYQCMLLSKANDSRKNMAWWFSPLSFVTRCCYYATNNVSLKLSLFSIWNDLEILLWNYVPSLWICFNPITYGIWSFWKLWEGLFGPVLVNYVRVILCLAFPSLFFLQLLELSAKTTEIL